jgi:hypothetical protein
MSLSFNADPRSAELQTSFQSLSAAASTLNAASDAFGEAIRALDEALNNLNPGVTAWVTFTRTNSAEEPWESAEERLGYAKTNGRWGLSLCNATVDERDGVPGIEECWLFNDAPRSLRLRAIEHVPTLISELAKEAVRTAKKVSEGANFAKQLAVSISAIAAGKGKR